MDVIVRGEPHELDFVRRICRDKIRRGVLAILPAPCPAVDEVVRPDEPDEKNEDNKNVELKDSKFIETSDTKEVKKSGRSKK